MSRTDMKTITLEKMKDLVECGLKAVRLDHLSVVINEGHIDIDGGTVSIAPEEIDHETKVWSQPSPETRTIKLPGWEVIWWEQTIGGPGYHDPPDYVDKPLYLGGSPTDAIRAAILAFHDAALDGAFGSYGIEAGECQ